jgi:hypothetical protein
MCAICDFKVEFDVDHPQTLTVAVATRSAIDDGILEPPSFEGPLGDMKQRLSAIAALKTLQARLEAALAPSDLAALADFYVLLIESRTWGFFHPTQEGFDPNCKTEPPRVTADDSGARDAVMVVADMTMQAVLDGKLSLSDALGRTMMIIDADAAEEECLRAALNKAVPATGFSRFICGSVVTAASV